MDASLPPQSCGRCGAENRSDRRFCHACGIPLPIACGACQFVNEPGSRFCGGCGSLIQDVVADTLARGGGIDPSGRDPWGAAGSEIGERKQVTVLFADLKSSLELLADRDPEDARKLLDSVLQLMIAAVHAYDGTVNQIMGDGIMALFGAPFSLEDHAVRACYAALRMHADIERLSAELRRVYGSDVRMRIGLNSGEVVVRSIRMGGRQMDYSAVGQTTHLAGRMEQLADPGHTLMTAATARLVESHVALKRVGFVPVRGMRTPVEVFELTDRRLGRARFHAGPGRGLSRFVGRERELARLQAAWEHVLNGAGRVVSIVGEPGVGKSRLVWEFMRELRHPGWLVLEGAAVAHGRNIAYLPLVEALRVYFHLDEALTPDQRRERIDARLETLGPEVHETRTEFLELFDLLDDRRDPLGDRRSGGLTPPQRRLRIVNAVKGLLLAEARVRPVCLVIEDLQWADSETAALVNALVDSMPAAQLLLVESHRAGLVLPWRDRSFVETVALEPLPVPTAEELLDSLLGRDPSIAALKRLLIERTEGNPFFLEESVDALVDTQVLEGERGAYRLVRAFSAVRVPATVRALLAARIDRRPPIEKEVLQTAAVVGRDVPARLLARVVPFAEDALKEALGNLEQADLLRRSRVVPEVELTFKHALTHEVAYDGLVQNRRRELHVKTAQAIEELYQGHLAEHIDQLARHAFHGELWGKALAFCREAGMRAFLRSAHRAAASYFDDALAAWRALPAAEQRTEEALDLLLDLRYALIPLGDLARILDCLREAERLARIAGDQRRLGLVLSFLTNYFHVVGDLDQTLAHGQQALEIATAIGDSELHAIVTAYLGQAYHTLGDYRRAIEVARSNLAPPEGDLRHERLGMAMPPSVYSRFTLVCALGEVGDFEEGIAIGNEGLRIADAVDHPYSRIFAYLGLGTLYTTKGDVDDAIRVLEPALEACSAADVPVLVSLIAGPLGSAYAACGRVDDAIALLERAIAQAVSRGYTLGHSMRIIGLAEAYLRAGRVAEAKELAERALALASDLKARGYEAWALRLLGDTMAVKDAAAALGAYERATALAVERGMRPLAARCWTSWGCALAAIGERAAAEAHIREAFDLMRAMDMRQLMARTAASHPDLLPVRA